MKSNTSGMMLSEERVIRIFPICAMARSAIVQNRMARDTDSGNFMLPNCKAAMVGSIAGERLNVWAGRCVGVIEALTWTGSSIEGGK